MSWTYDNQATKLYLFSHNTNSFRGKNGFSYEFQKTLCFNRVVLPATDLLIMSDKKIEQLRKENSELLKKVEDLSKSFKDVKEVQSKMAPETNATNEVQSLKNELNEFKKKFETKLVNLSLSLDDISIRAYGIEASIDAIEKYSYQYNIKIIGIPLTTRTETAEKTSQICLFVSQDWSDQYFN